MAGGQRPEELTSLVFEMPPPAPEGWDPGTAAWERRLSLHLDSEGLAAPGPAPSAPEPGPGPVVTPEPDGGPPPGDAGDS